MDNRSRCAEVPDYRGIRGDIETLVRGYAPLSPPILRTLCTLADDECSFEQLGHLLDDASRLKERILSIANSAYYAPCQPIEDVNQAAARIGMRPIISLVLWNDLKPYLGRLVWRYGYGVLGLWEHSIAVAAAGWSIAESLGLPAESCQRIYVAGLFHDTGKLVIADLLTQNGVTWDLRETPYEPPGLVSLERRVLGSSHEEAGKLLAEHWHLDPWVQDLIEAHHMPGDTASREVAVLHFADYLISNLAIGSRDDLPLPPETPLDSAVLDYVIESSDSLGIAEQTALREAARALIIAEALR